MSNQKLIDALNKVQAWELTGTIQYLQHGLLVSGIWRVSYSKFFNEMSEEAHGHARLIGDKIIALGGVPTVEPNLVRQATQLKEMIKLDLELERAALDAYFEARDVAEELGLRAQVFFLEERIAEEQLHVEDLERILADGSELAAALPGAGGVRSAG